MSPRELALDLVIEWQKSSSLADELIGERLGSSGLSAADRALVRELFYGWLRRRLYLETAVNEYVTRPPRREIQAILELAVYQLFYLDRIPSHAAVNEAVTLAKDRSTAAEARFVNAILRRISNNIATIVEKLLGFREREPWVFYSHPRWLWQRWQTRWGASRAGALCEWNNQAPPVYARVNTLKGTDPDPLCRRVDDPGALLASEEWKQGRYYIQDPSTLLAVDWLDPQPGDEVLDVCAAPGGKTTYIAQKMQNRGKIIAADSSNHRLGRVAENCKRLGIEIVATLPCDGTRLDRCLRGSGFDRVLVDAPCSNTGVMRRRPDLRWRLESSEIERLAALQLRLLRSAAGFARPGGRLVYSTCSLEPEENEGVVETFAAGTAGFRLESTKMLFPPEDGMDGAYVAVFERRG
jgi:16S rRNA (cytosine967-C5)-methyltransferase